MQRIKELLRKPGVRYLIVGGSVYVLELLIILIGQRSGLSAVVAVAVAFCIGTLLSFLLQKFVTFSDNRLHHKVIGAQLFFTVALVLFNLGFTLAVTSLLQHALPAVVIRTLAIAVTTLWNFYLYKTRIFKGSPELIT